MLLPFFVSAYTTPEKDINKNECVILLHGIFTSGVRMTRIHHRLHKEGYAVLSITYPSRSMCIEEIAEHIAPLLEGFSTRYHTLHMVGYSMGGLVARAYLAHGDAVPISRLVCIGTPNKGTEYIDRLRKHRRLKQFFSALGGPSGNSLGTEETYGSIMRTLGDVAPPNTETGIIAGITKFTMGITIPRPHDGYVPVARTILSGMKDLTVVHHSHINLPLREQVVREVVHFITHGSFVESHYGEKDSYSIPHHSS